MRKVPARGQGGQVAQAGPVPACRRPLALVRRPVHLLQLVWSTLGALRARLVDTCPLGPPLERKPPANWGEVASRFGAEGPESVWKLRPG
eukprot:3287099-Pyramimonas_sp.AAC.1